MILLYDVTIRLPYGPKKTSKTLIFIETFSLVWDHSEALVTILERSHYKSSQILPVVFYKLLLLYQANLPTMDWCDVVAALTWYQVGCHNTFLFVGLVFNAWLLVQYFRVTIG